MTNLELLFTLITLVPTAWISGWLGFSYYVMYRRRFENRPPAPADRRRIYEKKL